MGWQRSRSNQESSSRPRFTKNAGCGPIFFSWSGQARWNESDLNYKINSCIEVDSQLNICWRSYRLRVGEWDEVRFGRDLPTQPSSPVRGSCKGDLHPFKSACKQHSHQDQVHDPLWVPAANKSKWQCSRLKQKGFCLVCEHHTSNLIFTLHLNSETRFRGLRLFNCRQQLNAGRAVSGSEHCLNFTSGWTRNEVRNITR